MKILNHLSHAFTALLVVGMALMIAGCVSVDPPLDTRIMLAERDCSVVTDRHGIVGINIGECK